MCTISPARFGDLKAELFVVLTDRTTFVFLNVSDKYYVNISCASEFQRSLCDFRLRREQRLDIRFLSIDRI